MRELADAALEGLVLCDDGDDPDGLLRSAFGNGEFELFFQPLIGVETGAINGCKALLRWHHPQRGSVPPAKFIPAAEEMGLIVKLGDWVLRRACAEAAAWPSFVRLAVNLSALQFADGGLARTAASAHAASRLPADRLELEITESVLLRESEANLVVLHELRTLGVRISMDDFGTGHSSLSYLRSFPFDKLKIDRSFVAHLGESEECLAIVRAVMGLGRGLGIATVAEGVETEQQLRRLRLEGCSEVQGHLLGRPQPAEDLRELLMVSGRTDNPATLRASLASSG